MYDEKELKWFDRYNLQRPVNLPHGEDTYENPISAKLEKMNGSNWRMEGNKLICDTPNGPMAQFLPVDYIMTGVDDQGLPLLKKIDIV